MRNAIWLLVLADWRRVARTSSRLSKAPWRICPTISNIVTGRSGTNSGAESDQGGKMNHRCQMTKEIRIPKSERADDLDQFGSPNAHKPRSVKISAENLPFGIRHWSFLRNSSLVIRHSVLLGLLILLAFSGVLYGQTN